MRKSFQKLRILLPLIILAGFVFVFFLRLFYPALSIFMIPDFGESDVLHLNLPFKYFLSQSLQNHQWPLWTPYLASGFPILAEGQIGTFYLPNLVLFRFLPLVPAYNLNMVLSYLLAGIGMYLFARKWGLSSVSSFFSAFIFTFSGFLSVHLNHFNLIQASALLPILFWAATLLWQKPNFKYSLLFAFILSQQIFTGHFYIVFIALTGIAVYIITLCITAERCSAAVTAKKIFFFLLGLLLAFLLSAIQLLPTIELWQLSGRQSGLDFSAVTDYPYPFKHFLAFINPYIFGNPVNGTYPLFSFEWGIFWENTAYVGIIPLILGLTGIFFVKTKPVRAFAVSLVISLFLVLGKNSPFYFVFSIFPFNLFRVPSKFLLLSTFFISILAAHTIEKATGYLFKLPTQMKTAAFICVGIAFLFIFADEYRFSYNYPPASPAAWWTAPPEITKIIGKNKRVISPTAPNDWNEVFYKKGWQDIKPYLQFKNSLYPNLNALFSIGNADINTGGLVPRRLSFITSMLKDIAADGDKKEASVSGTLENVLNMTSTNYLISSYKIKSDFLAVKNTISSPSELGPDPLFVYENLTAFPRAYLSFNTRKIQTVEDFKSALAGDGFTKSPTVLVEEEALNLGINGSLLKPANITSENPSEVNLEAASDTNAVLVLADTNYPGWESYIDGAPANIYDVNLIQRGIYFPRGNHRVKFVFISESFETGKKLTLLTLFTVSSAVFLYPLFSRQKSSGKPRLSAGRGNTTPS